MKAFTNAWLAGLPRFADAPLTAASLDDFRFADQLHAFADQLHRQRIVAHADAFVVRHKVPAFQRVAGDLVRIRPGHVTLEPHRRLLQADADQLHAIVGFDHHLGEVRVGGNAADGDHLHAELVAELLDDELFLIGARQPRAHLVQELVHPREAFFGRIDRAVDERILLAATRGKRPQGDDQVLQLDHRPARIDAQHATRRRFAPGLGRAGDHDVARLRIAEHVLHARQSGEILHHVVGAFALRDPLGQQPARAE